MYAIIFEVWPFAKGRDRYFELAAQLKQILVSQPGFISVERFQSLIDEESCLAYPFGNQNRQSLDGKNSLITLMPRKRARKSCLNLIVYG